MDYSNMFSDLAPIFGSGYRAQRNSDPAIKQGVQFLNDERSIVNGLIPNLNLISQTDGSGMGSAKIVNGRILEGLTTTTTSPTDTNPAPVPSSTTSSTTTQASPQVTAVSQETINSLKNQYQTTLNSLNANMNLLTTNAGGGIADNNDMTPIGQGVSFKTGDVRKIILQNVGNIRNNLDSIYSQITQATNNNIILTNQEYEAISKQLNDINMQIINNYRELNKPEMDIDYVSPVAGAEETSILSTQRYYVYILWFIITIIVLYITISNLINPSSSTWSLAVSLIIIIGLFAFLLYNNIGTWYTRVDNDIRSMEWPNFNNVFNFDPLVSIKYTS